MGKIKHTGNTVGQCDMYVVPGAVPSQWGDKQKQITSLESCNPITLIALAK